LEGCVDLLTDDLIAGWAWDSGHPERHVTVQILVNDRPVTQILAQQYRADLKDAGIGDGTYAFYYSPLSPSPIDPDRQKISVRVLETGVRLERSRPAQVAAGDRAALNSPPIKVDLSANAIQLQAMHNHINSTWAQLGEIEPYWSVLTHPNFRADQFFWNKSQFFESAKGNIDDFLAFAARSSVRLSPEHVCFELGCGVGRLTVGLAQMFSRVVAADISVSHLKIAEDILRQQGMNNVSLVQLNRIEDLEKLIPFDVFFSVIVFQHNPPPIMAYMLKTILTKLHTHGIGYFQIPTYSKGYSFDPERYLAQIKERQHMEMHVLPFREVTEIIYGCGCKLLEVREDGWTGDVNGVSNTFLVQKQEPVAV
jgi:2-polyprenyl-3-methyl-5-hydroxy-6-metoxy-1,4-benzoquinol methylase